MAQITLHTTTEVVACVVTPDGRIEVVEETNFWTGASAGQGEKFVKPAPQSRRIIDIGADVSNEIQLIKDIVNGNLHTPERAALRQVAIEAEQTANQTKSNQNE